MPAVLVAAHLGGLLEPDQLGVRAVVLEERVDLELPEAAGEADVPLGRQLGLVAEEDHLVLEQGPSDLGDDLVGQVRSELHPAQLGADRGAQRGGIEAVPRQGGEALALGLQVTEGSGLDAVGQAEAQRARIGHSR